MRGALLLAAGCVGLSWWLVPRQDELVERMLLDQQYDRMAEYLRASLGEEASTFRSTDLARLSAKQLTFLSRLLRLTPREQLQTVFLTEQAPGYDKIVHSLVLRAIKYADVIPPGEAWKLIRPRIDLLSSEQKLELSTVLAANALASGQPALSGKILAEAIQLPEAGWSHARDMALAHRWSDQSRKGAELLREWLTRLRESLPAGESAEAFALGRAMALEGGEPGLAFDFCADELRATELITEEQMRTAYDLAMQAERGKDIVPWIERRLAALPEARLDWRGLVRLARESPESLAATRHWTGLLAQFCDWNSEFDHAYEHHFRLAAAGSVESLDRCLALNDFLGRDEDTVELLETLLPVAERPALRVELARLLAGLGRDSEAKATYQEWIAGHPRDRDARFNLGCLLEDTGDEPGSKAAFAELVEIFPADAPAIKRLADAHIRAGEPAAALKCLASLKEADHEEYTLESYAMLSVSLDEHAHLYSALRMALNKNPQPDSAAYIDLATAASQLEDSKLEIAALDEGIARLPESALLRISLSDAWFRNNDYDRALAALTAKPALRQNPAAVAKALSLAGKITDPRRVLDFVGADAERRFPLPSIARLDLAVLHRLCGDIRRSEALFATVPETPDNLRQIALARFESGDLEQAARLMAAHVQAYPRAAASEWIFLGEIYDGLGRTEDARRAFDYSLALLTADLPDTAFAPDRKAPAPAATP